MEYILIAYIWAGTFSKGDSVAIINVGTFYDMTSCNVAGKSMNTLVSGTTKEYRYKCVERPVK